jgi:hypothetical protein
MKEGSFWHLASWSKNNLTELVAMNNEQGSDNKHSETQTTLQIFDIFLANPDDRKQTLVFTTER